MLKKKERLTKKEFNLSFLNGKRVHTPTIQLIYDATKGFHGAAVVGKKVFKKAVSRNRLRRRMYGALYRCHKKHNLTGTYILIAKPAAKEITSKEVGVVIEEALSKNSKK